MKKPRIVGFSVVLVGMTALLVAITGACGSNSTPSSTPSSSIDPSVDPSEACTANVDCFIYYTCACHACLTKSVHADVCDKPCPTDPCAGKKGVCVSGKCTVR